MLRDKIGKPWLIYGAYGFTGRLIAKVAADRGHAPILAGRDRHRLWEQAKSLGLEIRAFPLDDRELLAEGLDGVEAVVHAAGPFSRTSRPMVDACLAAGVHYLDITGEIPVFETLFALHDAAKRAGIAIVPGVGFDVVPTDCAAARAAGRIDEPSSLTIAFSASGSPSRGTTRTVVEGLGGTSAERVDGKLVAAPYASHTRQIPFSDRPRFAVGIPWGDVSTAWHSTGVPNIRVYMATPEKQVAQMRLLARARPILALSPVQSLLKWAVGRTVSGPGAKELEQGGARVWCQATNQDGAEATVELTTPNGYWFTALAAVAAVEELLSDEGDSRPTGAMTPSRAFGADFVDRIEGVHWTMP